MQADRVPLLEPFCSSPLPGLRPVGPVDGTLEIELDARSRSIHPRNMTPRRGIIVRSAANAAP